MLDFFLLKTKINLLFSFPLKVCPKLQVQRRLAPEAEVAPFTYCLQEGRDSPTWKQPSAHLPSWLPEYISSFTSQPPVSSALLPRTASEPTFASQRMCTWVHSRAVIKTQSNYYFQPEQLPELHSWVGGGGSFWPCCLVWSTKKASEEVKAFGKYEFQIRHVSDVPTQIDIFLIVKAH